MIEEKAKIEEDIQRLVGMAEGKRFFEKIKDKIDWQEKSGNAKQVQNKSYNMVTTPVVCYKLMNLCGR